ncbi:hypothetical protein BJF92_07065 [Rhizobium rhizosphaerae]|uniref:Uncharacterized protein n=2 Tax=Xaviernesmea rhizosphaerae TaxID=1672749 RepID=A0A1Q9AQH9_9HYPH|nr:hypothetical protein BJF92_07065 [Xaviernesmea rhizosphaerae]
MPAMFRPAIARGSQPAVVKLVSFAAGKARVGKLLGYQSRGGELPVEDENGDRLAGRDWIRTLASEWAEEDGRAPSKDVLRLSLTLPSARLSSDEEVGEVLKGALPGHRIAWQSDLARDGEGRGVALVISAARRRLEGETRAGRIFDNRKSLRDLEMRLKDAFGAETRVEMQGFSHGVEGVARGLGQLQKQGRDPIIAVRLDRAGAFVGQHALGGERSIIEEARDWKRDLRSQQRRDVAHLVLSAKPGTPKDAFVSAACAMLAREFAGHRFLFTLHEDRAHLHVHAVVKMVSETGKRLHPRIEDLRRWRAVLAQEARERNIPMDAVSRFERANPPGYKMKDIRRIERGEASEALRRRVEAVRQQAVHVPTRPEGLRHAAASAAGWSAGWRGEGDLRPEPPQTPGATPLDRAQPFDGRAIDPVDAQTLRRLRARSLDAVLIGVATAADRNARHLPGAKEPDMADLETMSSAFAEMETNLDIVAKALPPERLAAFDALRRKLKVSQTRMIEAQTAIEAGRGRIEGESWVQPVAQNFAGFIAETRGETIRYSLRSADGRTGAVAFTDQGDRVEVSRSRDREAVLAALELGIQKWGAVRVSGPDRYTALAVELAAKHGVRLTNPELQDKLTAARDRIARERSQRPGVMAGTLPPAQKPGDRQEVDGLSAENRAADQEQVFDRRDASQTMPREQAVRQTVAEKPAAAVTAPNGVKPPVDTGDKVKPADRDRASILQAMQMASQKWGVVAVNGSERDKAIAVELAAEHGFSLSNPDLQEKLAAAKARMEAQREMERTRERRQPGFVDSAEASPPVRRTDAEIAVALETVKEKTQAEATREVRQAKRSVQTGERPINGGGDDHVYRTKAEASAAVRAEKAVAQDPARAIPSDVSQSPEIERQRLDQKALLSEKEVSRHQQVRKDKPRQR